MKSLTIIALAFCADTTETYQISWLSLMNKYDVVDNYLNDNAEIEARKDFKTKCNYDNV